jgi:hypothetical protein
VKKYFFLMMVAVVFFAQETLIKVKIDRRIESNLSSLFEALPERIEVFVTSDSTYIIEASFPNRKSVKRMTSAEYRDLIVRKPVELITIESAQISYLMGQTFLGLALYSWSLPVAISDNYDEGTLALGLLTPMLYTTSCFLATSHRRISSGAAYGSFLGGIEGAYHGGLIFKSVRGVFPVSIAENLLDFTLGQKMGFTPAMYQRKFNHCAYGYYHYFTVKILFAGEDFDIWDFENEDVRLSALLSLGEGYTSLFLSENSEDLTFGDALFELRMSAIGAEALPLILATIDLYREGSNTDERIYAGLSLLGHSLGYLWGYKFTRDYDLPGAAGVMVWILPYLAHATTGGLVILSDSEGFSDAYPAIYLGTDILLTLACYKAFAKKSTDVGKADIPNFNISINPMCFMFKDKDKDKNFGKMPFLSFSYNFD